MDDKSANRRDLLDKLKLDRSAPDAGGGLQSGLLGLVLGAALAGGAAFLLWPGAAQVAPGQPAVAATSTPANGDGAAPTATPTPAPGDTVLSASGYVTARRLATVSTEITGKMRDMLVEEGTVVEAGQVVHHRVQVGTDGQAPVLEVVAGVDHHRQPLAQRPIQPIGQLGPAHAAGQGHDQR